MWLVKRWILHYLIQQQTISTYVPNKMLLSKLQQYDWTVKQPCIYIILLQAKCLMLYNLLQDSVIWQKQRNIGHTNHTVSSCMILSWFHLQIKHDWIACKFYHQGCYTAGIPCVGICENIGLSYFDTEFVYSM